MKNLWDTTEALSYQSDALKMRAYTSRLLGQNPNLVLHGGGNTSVKDSRKNIFGESEEILFVKGSGHDLRTIGIDGFSPTKLQVLKKLGALPALSDSDMMKELKMAQTDPSAPVPSVEAILHAIIPFRYVDHTHADGVVAISNSPNGEKQLEGIYGARVLILPYVMPGFILSKQVYQATFDVDWSKLDAIILLHHGVFTFSDDAKKSYDMMIEICGRAEKYLEDKGSIKHVARGGGKNAKEKFDLLLMAKLRKQVGENLGAPVIASLKDDEISVGFTCLENVASIATRGPITPDHVIQTKRIPMLAQGENCVAEYARAYRIYFEEHNKNNLTILDTSPRYALLKGQGILHFGQNAKSLQIIEDIVSHTVMAIQWAENLGGWKALPESDIFELEYWELEQAKLKRKNPKPAGEGKIALVTGAASGIGKACASELMKAGYCVVGLDISESVVETFKGLQYFGIKTDLTNAGEIDLALEKAIKKFGGLDLLVSNAGSFPASSMIESLDDDKWASCLELNLSSHFSLLKRSIPFLKFGFNPCVVFIGSKNVAAPGPGVSAYSVSKAGLAQLARVAAMELGPFGIRVNSVHPNAVFDTGIWGPEIVAGRAKNYGLSVEEYKKNNILKTVIESSDVAQVVLAMAMDSFSKTTGAHIPVDGGNDRVI